MLRFVSITTALGTALLLAAGCAPQRPELDVGEGGSGQMAVLASDGTGRFDVAILDANGTVRRTIDANLQQATSIAYHPDGFFLTSDWTNVLRIDMDGEVSVFNNQPLPSGVYRVSVNDDGDTTVAQEYDVTEVDPGGDVMASTNVPGTYCWMDSAPAPDSNSDAALIDVFGPNIATWDADSGSFDVIASNLGSGLDILGRTNGGDYVAASSYGERIVFAGDDGVVNDLGTLTSMGFPAYQVPAVEPAGRDSVFALAQGNSGSMILEVFADGEAYEVATPESGILWQDLVVF